MNSKFIEMSVHGDIKKGLSIAGALQNIPFEIKNVYYIFDTLPNESRGFHAYKNLEQIIVVMVGGLSLRSG